MIMENPQAPYGHELLERRLADARKLLQQTGLILLNNIANEFEVPHKGSRGIFHLRRSTALIQQPNKGASTVGLIVKIDPEPSTDNEFAYNARFINVTTWRKEHTSGVVFGEEDKAKLDTSFPSSDSPNYIPQDPELFAGHIADSLQVLKHRYSPEKESNI